MRGGGQRFDEGGGNGSALWKCGSFACCLIYHFIYIYTCCLALFKFLYFLQLKLAYGLLEEKTLFEI